MAEMYPPKFNRYQSEEDMGNKKVKKVNKDQVKKLDKVKVNKSNKKGK